MTTFNPRDARKSSRRAGVGPGGMVARNLWTDVILSFAIFVLAYSLRLAYLYQIESIPLFYHPAGDARAYDEWAQRIAAGDWLGDGVFYQAPLYPYFLGLLQFILGHDLWSIRVVQIFLGAASCSVIYWAGRQFFSRGAGIGAGLILSVYAPAIFFDALIQKTILDFFLLAVLLLLLAGARAQPRWPKWVIVGVLLGLLGLTRENALVWVLVVAAWIWIYFSAHRPPARLGWIAFLAVGLVLILFPVALRNLKAGGEFVLTTSQLGPNFFIGNNPAATGTYVPLRGGHGDPEFERRDATELAQQALGRPLSPGEVSEYWLRRSMDYIRSEPLHWLGLLGKKWLLVWNVRELEDADDFYLYQKWSRLLKGLGWLSHFGVLAPLAAIGLALTWRRWRELWLLYILLATFAFSVALFYVFGRYRFPLVPLLALFAGAGIAELPKVRTLPKGLLCGAVFLLTFVIVHLPIGGGMGPSASSYSNLGNAWARQGRFDAAVESYKEALKLNPVNAVVHYNLGNLLAARGDLKEATGHYREAVKISPDFAEAHHNLGQALAREGEIEEAMKSYRSALALNPLRSETHFNLGQLLAREERLDEAGEHLKHALKVNPNSPEAHQLSGRILAAQGRLVEAVEHFREATRLRPDFAEAHESLGRAYALIGKKQEAIEHYREALRILKSRQEKSRVEPRNGAAEVEESRK